MGHLLQNHLDIGAVPRLSFFELLSTLSTSELERDKLKEFCSAAGRDQLHAYCDRPRRTALEVTQGLGPGGCQTPDPGLVLVQSHVWVLFCFRFWQISLTPQLKSKWTTSWTCSLRSRPGPSPSPRL